MVTPHGELHALGRRISWLDGCIVYAMAEGRSYEEFCDARHRAIRRIGEIHAAYGMDVQRADEAAILTTVRILARGYGADPDAAARLYETRILPAARDARAV